MNDVLKGCERPVQGVRTACSKGANGLLTAFERPASDNARYLKKKLKKMAEIFVYVEIISYLCSVKIIETRSYC